LCWSQYQCAMQYQCSVHTVLCWSQYQCAMQYQCSVHTVLCWSQYQCALQCQYSFVLVPGSMWVTGVQTCALPIWCCIAQWYWDQHKTVWTLHWYCIAHWYWGQHKTVWTLHWYCIGHWYWDQHKTLESKAINWQWVAKPAASSGNIWQIFKNNIRSTLHCNCKNMSAGLPLLFYLSAVSSNYSNFLLSSFYVTFMANILVSMCEM
jgi:hypothetical protein